LKKGVTFEQLDKIAYSHSDNEFAKMMREEEKTLPKNSKSRQRKRFAKKNIILISLPFFDRYD